MSEIFLCIHHTQNQTFFMGSAHQKVAPFGTKLRQSSLLHSYQEQSKGEITISSVASTEPQIVSIDWDSSGPTITYWFGNQHPVCHPASMISTCHPTHSMCWLRRQSFNQMMNTAPNHRGRPTRPQSLRPQWTWVPLKAGKHRSQLQTKIHFIPRTNLVSSIGIFLLAKVSTLTSPDKYPSLRARSAYRRLQDDKREASRACGGFFPKRGECRRTLVRHAASPYQKERQLMLREKLKH